ncbi:MAG: helix-turn-helix transcriptional regulator [Alistipes sp.]|nr:helix-turn-helix transcriptional regulator [Alistipes sp.]
MEYEIFYTKFVFMKATEQKKLKQQLASRLYQTRNELGIKQIDLQNEGIISQSHLSKIENGDINVSAIMLYKLAQRYGKDLSYFFK